ncbi:unnamed protein product [Schistosoma margrebowiei]|uniref:Uncharacterized protein n=1 Tax=Schistosoma margrebowiei TaxID=48269 RepID=A0A183MFX3_9TREM|nr:unnamed protein product [Schistosoma margrebowiei]
MGSILSRFSSRKDEKSDTDSRSATSIRKRFSWRSNKKPADVGGTSVNRSSTMPARTRLQPTEETPEDRKHDDIFDSEQDEKSYSKSVVKPNQNDDTSQHSSRQLEQHNVECAKKPIVCEIPGGKDEKQPIQITSTNEPENKDNMARTISTEEAELLIGRVIPNQENVSPHENITLSGTNSSLTHDNINFNHTEDLTVNKQQLQETFDHSIHDLCLTMDQQEITKDHNGFVDDTQHHFQDKTDLLKDDIHSEIVREEIKLEQNPPVYLSSEEKEEFVHQNIRKDDSTEQLNVENDIIEQECEENLNIESSSHREFMQSSPAVCFSRSNVVEYPPPEQTQLVDIDEQTYNQQTNNIPNIQSSETVEEKDLIHEQVVQNELLECSAEPHTFHNLSNKEEFANLEHTDTDNKVDFVETENTLDNVISEHVEQKDAFQETVEKEFNESLINASETEILSADEPPINLNDDIHIEQTENLSHHKDTEHEAPIDGEETLNELDKCLSQPGLTNDPMHSVSPIITEPINLNDDIHVEQTENLSHSENTESINLNDDIHIEQTENLSYHKDAEHEAPIDGEETLNELDKCLSQPGLTYDPMHSVSPITAEPINLNDDIHVEQTENLSHSENTESINLNDDIHIEQTENLSYHKDTEHEAPIDEEETLNELDKCLSQPDLTYDPMHSVSPITAEPINLNDDIHVEQTENLSHSENTESINLNDDIRAEQTEYTSPSEYNVNNNISTEKFIDTVVESSVEPVMEYDFSSNESRLTSELVLSEENREATTDVDLEHPTEDIKTEDIHHKQANDTETLTTLEESVNQQNTMNSTPIDDEIDQHQILEVSYNENHSDVPVNTDIIDVITSDNLHTNLISTNDVLKQQDVFNSMSMNDDNNIIKNLENSKNNEIHEFENEAQSLVQSVLNNAKEFVFNENNSDNHYNSDNMTNNNNNNNDYLTTNNNSSMNEEDTIEMKQDITMKTSMEFDHSDLSELNNQLLKNTNDLAIA